VETCLLKLKDTYVLSLDKGEIEIMGFYPCFLCDSPFNPDKQVLALIHNSEKLEETQFEHFRSIYAYNKDRQFQWKLVDFELDCYNPEFLAENFRCFLKTQFVSQGLQLIGGYTKKSPHDGFKLIMYDTNDNLDDFGNFDLEIEVLHGDITSENFEKYLNAKYWKEHWVFMSVFTLTLPNRTNDIFGHSKNSMNLIVFQNMMINYAGYNEPFNFKVKQFPSTAQSSIDENDLLNEIELEQETNQLEFLGVVPGNQFSDSLMVFADRIKANKQECTDMEDSTILYSF